MEINIKATPEEVAKLLQAIGGSEEQLKIKLPVEIKDDKITFREVDLSQNVIREDNDSLLLVNPKTKQTIAQLKNGEGITLYPEN